MEGALKPNRTLPVTSITFALLLIQWVYLAKTVVIIVHRKLWLSLMLKLRMFSISFYQCNKKIFQNVNIIK